ncbi:MAG: transcription elongation factor GreA [Thermoleophilaceae bacterium]
MPEQTPTAMTPDGLRALREELERLETEGRRDVAERIKTAREWGDLKENAEYHAAKEDQAHLETRIARLADQLRGAVVVDAPAEAGVVSFGSTVSFLDESSGKAQTFTLVGSHEASSAEGKLSGDSPVAKALIGHGEGDTVVVSIPRGERRLTITKVGA